MFVLLGWFVVIASVLGGFAWAGGHVHSLIHPSEILTIGGASLGALIVMSSPKSMKDLVAGIIACFKSPPFGKSIYQEAFKLLYELMKTARRDGLLSLESHVSNPHDSDIFNRYPRISHNHHVVEFISGAFAPLIDGSVKPESLGTMLDSEIAAIEEEHHIPLGALTKMADGLPGFGIVAAVLGIVITMGHINGPVEEIGHKVGAALVGTFLGILASYGFIAPLAGRMEAMGGEELAFFRCMAASILGFVNNLPPKVAIEVSRRGLPGEVRPSREDVEQFLADVDANR